MSDIIALQITSTNTLTAAPWTFGHVFKKGDVPSGQDVVGSNTSAFQCSHKNYWDDGSLRFAIISGYSDLVAATPLSVMLSHGTPTAGSDITTAAIVSSGLSLTYGTNSLFGSATISGSDWNSPTFTFVEGPVVSIWLFRKAIDTHLTAWVEVRAYSDGSINYLPWVENGHLLVAGPTNKNTTYTLNALFTRAMDLKAHVRTVLLEGTKLSYWNITDPDIIPKHNAAYWSESKHIPKYRKTTPDTSTTLNTLPATFVPLQRGNWQVGMGSAGWQPDIGIIPNHEALYFTNGSRITYEAVLRNALGHGRYRIHHRDESTFKPVKFSTYPTLGYGSGGGISATGTAPTYTPAATGGTATGTTYVTSHHPSTGYIAYLLSGWYYFCEEIQFMAQVMFLKQISGNRQGAKGIIQSQAGANTERGAAWALRTIAQACLATPDDVTLVDDYRYCISENAIYYYNKYVGQTNNPFGVVHPYGDYGTAEGTGIRFSGFMDSFFNASMGFIKAIGDHTMRLTDDTKGKFRDFYHWKVSGVIGRLGGTGTDEWLYRDAAEYEVPLGPNQLVCPATNGNCPTDFVTGTGPWRANWGEQWDVLFPTGVREEGDLRGGNFPFEGSYWSNLLPGIAYAVEHESPGALEGYNRMINASNWPLQDAKYADWPVWGVEPGNTLAATIETSTSASFGGHERKRLFHKR